MHAAALLALWPEKADRNRIRFQGDCNHALAMGSFFTTERKEDRTLKLPAGTPAGRVSVAITPVDEGAPVMDRAAEPRASTRQQTADAILLAAAMHGGSPALGAPPGG
jgi:hypothetical protein